MPGAVAEALEHLLRHLGDQLGSARADGLGHPHFRLSGGRLPAREGLSGLCLTPVDVLDRHPLDLPILIDEVDRAPVGERGHGETGDVAEGDDRVRGGGEEGTGIGQEAPGDEAPPLLGDVGADHQERFDALFRMDGPGTHAHDGAAPIRLRDLDILRRRGLPAFERDRTRPLGCGVLPAVGVVPLPLRGVEGRRHPEHSLELLVLEQNPTRLDLGDKDPGGDLIQNRRHHGAACAPFGSEPREL